MLDEEGYMALSPRIKPGCSMHYSGNPEIQEAVLSTGTRKTKIAAGVLGTGFVVFGLTTVALLCLFVFQGRLFKHGAVEVQNGTQDNPGNEHSPCSQGPSYLREVLCSTLTDASQCKLCPINWISRKEKCYWFSNGTPQWLQAFINCSSMGAHLVVMKDEAKKSFIQKNIEGEYRFWIGLIFANPELQQIWADDSRFNQSLFEVFTSEGGKNCGVIQADQLRSEMCSDKFKWICERDAVVL